MLLNYWTVLKLAFALLPIVESVQEVDVQPLRKFYSPKPLANREDGSISKVTLTQKGYIQFLRYITNVPTINEFTFCIWLRSSNLTNNQPILSYSLREKERYIRAWVTQNGRTVNMELLNNLIFSVPVKMNVNRWYHLCQSWDNLDGQWQFYFNGKLKAQGIANKLRGLSIPPKGDVVVGQEYTDFDKGLDDGIEGDIYGFNLLLTAASSKSSKMAATRYTKWLNYAQEGAEQAPLRIQDVNNGKAQNGVEFSKPVGGEDGAEAQETNEQINKEVPSVLGYFPMQHANRMAKGFWSFGQQLLKNMFNFFTPEPPKPIRIRVTQKRQNQKPAFGYESVKYLNQYPNPNYNLKFLDQFQNQNAFLEQLPDQNVKLAEQYKVIDPGLAVAAQTRDPNVKIVDQAGDGNVRYVFESMDQLQSPNVKIAEQTPNLDQLVQGGYNTKRILNDIEDQTVPLLSTTKSLGLALVELGFRNCALGKGSPISDKRVVVSWTRTPVRVFGGAMWKPIPPFCKNSYKFWT